MNCHWCNNQTNRPTARVCNMCGTPLLDGTPLGNYTSGAWLRGRYQIRKLLGAGGMGTVYGALDKNLPGRRVAVKEFDPAKCDPQSQPAAQMFQSEAQMLARLDHPNIPKVSDYFAEGQRQYQVMDYVDGYTLEEILQRQRVLAEQQLLPIVHQVCAALNYLHNQNPPVIFRDLKPSNIMMSKTGHVKVIDFGIARTFKTGKSKDTQQMGTTGFAAPEQYGRGQSDARSDIYALCATMYAALTGYDVSITPLNFPPLRALAPQLSAITERVITTGLELDPNRRWQNVQQLAAQLSVAPITPGGTAPIGAQAQAGRVRVSAPTQKLGMMLAQLSDTQLTVALLALTALTGAAMWLLTPILVKVPLFWHNVEFSAMIGALAYTATRRRGAAGIAQAVIAATGGIVTQNRLGYMPEAAVAGIGAALLCGGFVELWLRALDPKKDSSVVWVHELLWLIPMAIIAATLVRLPYGLNYAVNIVLVITSAVLGGLGWFCGDLVQQTLYYRQFGRRR